jgi:RNA polymerase sigma-70 factor (ECF subfamily)
MAHTLGDVVLGDWAASHANDQSGQLDVAALVSEYAALLYRVALSIVRQPAEAEDIVQETFIRLLQNSGQWKELREPRPWLVRIAWNLAIDRTRRVRPEQMDEATAVALVARELSAEDALVQARNLTCVLAQVDRLPKLEREVLLLSAFDELTNAEIAAVLRRSESSVRSILFRARAHLQERISALEARKGGKE